jgi:hypothetical protein
MNFRPLVRPRATRTHGDPARPAPPRDVGSGAGLASRAPGRRALLAALIAGAGLVAGCSDDDFSNQTVVSDASATTSTDLAVDGGADLSATTAGDAGTKTDLAVPDLATKD